MRLITCQSAQERSRFKLSVPVSELLDSGSILPQIKLRANEDNGSRRCMVRYFRIPLGTGISVVILAVVHIERRTLVRTFS